MKNTKTPHEVNLSLLNFYVLHKKYRHQELEEIVRTLNSLFFYIELKEEKINEIGLLEYIETDDFLKLRTSMDHKIVSLMKLISNL